jgi:PAS domain S-box-containing protein
VALTGEPLHFEDYSGVLRRHFQITAYCPKRGQFACVFMDITQRKLAEEKNAKLAAIVESSLDGIISKNLDGIITTWNPGAKKLFGYAPEEIIGTSILRLIPADRVAEENEILRRIRLGENVMHFDTVRQLKSGQLLEVSVTASPIRDATGQILGVSKMIRDISERKQAQQALANERVLLRNLVDNLPVAVYLCVEAKCGAE